MCTVAVKWNVGRFIWVIITIMLFEVRCSGFAGATKTSSFVNVSIYRDCRYRTRRMCPLAISSSLSFATLDTRLPYGRYRRLKFFSYRVWCLFLKRHTVSSSVVHGIAKLSSRCTFPTRNVRRTFRRVSKTSSRTKTRITRHCVLKIACKATAALEIRPMPCEGTRVAPFF